MPQDLSTLVGVNGAEATDSGHRSEEILSLARHAFVEKGFDGASMQDLAKAAGMSAGNFYRYFPSKAALVEALIARDFLEVEETFRAISTSDDPLAALKAALRERVIENCRDDDPLWAEIMAVAARKPDIAALLAGFEMSIVRQIVSVLGLVSQLPDDEAFRRFETHARVIVLIVRGSACGSNPCPAADSALNELILKTIDRLIDDVLAGKDH